MYFVFGICNCWCIDVSSNKLNRIIIEFHCSIFLYWVYCRLKLRLIFYLLRILSSVTIRGFTAKYRIKALFPISLIRHKDFFSHIQFLLYLLTLKFLKKLDNIWNISSSRLMSLVWFIATFNHISVISWRQFIGGGNRSSRRKPPTCSKSLTYGCGK